MYLYLSILPSLVLVSHPGSPVRRGLCTQKREDTENAQHRVVKADVREGVPEGKANIGGGATDQEPAGEAVQETGGLLQGRTGEMSCQKELERCQKRNWRDLHNGQSNFQWAHTAKKGHQSAKKGHQSTKKGHQSTKKRHQSTKKGHQSTKKGHQSNKKGHQSAKKGHQSTKKGHQSTKKGHQSTKKGHQSKKTSVHQEGTPDHHDAVPILLVEAVEGQQAAMSPSPMSVVSTLGWVFMMCTK